jgi:very-short-patch-repair endonuclease
MEIKVENNPGCLNKVLSLLGLLPKSKLSNRDQYLMRGSIFSPNEIAFYEQLKIVVGDRFVVLPKVRMADVFDIKSLSNSQRQSSLNRINSRHFDFLICEPETYSPRFVIELDDKSHTRAKRISSDQFKNEICRDLNLKLIRIPASMGYSPERIRDQILAVFHSQELSP